MANAEALRYTAGVRLLVGVFGVVLLPAFAVASDADQPQFVIRRPTMLAFFPHVTQEELERDPDTNEALADFQVYAMRVREPLSKMGIAFEIVDAPSFRVISGSRTIAFRPRAPKVGYYLIAPGKRPRIVYGVQTDADILELATEYFDTTKKNRRN